MHCIVCGSKNLITKNTTFNNYHILQAYILFIMNNEKHQSIAVKMSKNVSEVIELEKINKNQERIGPETGVGTEKLVFACL